MRRMEPYTYNIHMYVYIYIYIHVCICIFTCIHICVCIHAHMYAINKYEYEDKCKYSCACKYKHTHTETYTHIYICHPFKNLPFYCCCAWGQQFSTFETPSPRINNSRTENWKHLPQESTTQEQRMIVATIELFPGEECCDTLHRTGQL